MGWLMLQGQSDGDFPPFARSTPNGYRCTKCDQRSGPFDHADCTEPAERPFPLKRQGELADFCRWLCDTGQIPHDPFEVVEKPDKYRAEYEQWLRTEEQDALADQFSDDDRWAA